MSSGAPQKSGQEEPTGSHETSGEEPTPPPFWRVRGVLPTLLILVAIGLLIWKPGAQDDPRLSSRASDGAPPTITRGTKERDGTRVEETSNDAPGPPLSPEEAKAGCLVPDLDTESVPSMDIVYEKGSSTEPTGGTITPGLYRLTAAYSPKEAFTAGRWSMLLDLTESGHGAYYRRIGLRPQKSRIRWKTNDTRFTFQMFCPDKGRREFDYSVTDMGFLLITSDGFLLPFERVGESRVTLLEASKP